MLIYEKDETPVGLVVDNWERLTVFVCPISVFQLIAIAALSLLSATSPVGASQLYTLWCTPNEAPAFFVFINPRRDQDEVWIDDQKMHFQETKSSDNVSQTWLVDLDTATFVEVKELEIGKVVALEGVMNGKVMVTTCKDISKIFLNGVRLSDPLLSKHAERAEEDVTQAQQEIAALSLKLKQKTEELAILREGIETGGASLTQNGETHRKALEAMQASQAKLAALEKFASLVRKDTVAAKNLPNDYVVLFNERYWGLLREIEQ